MMLENSGGRTGNGIWRIQSNNEEFVVGCGFRNKERANDAIRICDMRH